MKNGILISKIVKFLWLIPFVYQVACTSSEPLVLSECGNTQTCGGEFIYAIDEMKLAAVDEAGTVQGFDVDGLVSAGDQDEDCDTADYTSPDGVPGIDNQITKLLDSVGPGITDLIADALQATINSGGLILLMELIGMPLDESRRDGSLVIRIADDAPLIGTNDRLLAGQTFRLPPDPLLGQTESLRIENELSIAGPFPLDFRFEFLATPVRMPVAATWVRFTAPVDSEIQGVLGGYMTISDLLGAISFIGGDDEQLRLTLEAILPGLADVQDESGDCENLSFALSFHAVPAYIFEGPVGGHIDPDSPEYLFSKGTCGGCHTVTGVIGARGFLGPALDGLGERAGVTVTGQSAEAYIRESIVDPGAHVVPDYEGTMPQDVARFLTDEELDILLAWLALL